MNPSLGHADRGIIPAIILNTAGLYSGNLAYYFRVLFKKARNVSNPYHNFRHMFYVFCCCFEACEFYNGGPEKLKSRQVRNLLIAAMFHDFDHSGRPGHDDLEIERAIRGLRQHILDEDRAELDEIELLIRNTKFPYDVSSYELDLSSQILRDADLSQALGGVWMQQVLFGLGEEMNVTPMQMLETQTGFLRKLSFSTAWAQAKFPEEVVDGKVREVHGLLEILSEK
jgi:hypothetical protein